MGRPGQCQHYGKFVRRQRTVAGERGNVDEMRRTRHQSRQRSSVILFCMSDQLLAPFRCSPVAFRPTQIEKFSAANRALRGGIAQNETITLRRCNWTLQNKLDKSL